MKQIVWGSRAALVLALALFGFTTTASATPLTDTDIIVGSALNGAAMQYITFNFGSNTFPGTPVFTSDGTDGFAWMHAGDYIDFYRILDTVDHFNVGFSNLDQFAGPSGPENSVPGDVIHMSFQLAPGLTFDADHTAPGNQISLLINNSLVSGNLLTFDLTNLDQIYDPLHELSQSRADYVVNAMGDTATVPEPATLTLMTVGGLALLRRRFLRDNS